MMQTLITILSGFAIILFLLKTKYPYLMADLIFAWKQTQARRQREKFARRKPYFTVLDQFLHLARTRPDKPFLLFEEEVHTYADGDRQSNRAARALRQHAGVGSGDTVALLLGNQPVYVWLWLGLEKLGCPSALVSYRTRAGALLHCLSCISAKVLIADAGVREVLEEVLPALRQQGVRVFLLGDGGVPEGMEALSAHIRLASDRPLPPRLRAEVGATSPSTYVYTSGTTGLPKAVQTSQGRAWVAALLLYTSGVESRDVVYISLPLYHMSGFNIGLLGAIERGSTVVLRRKFSASQFWRDCRRYNVTVVLYIGEILRYLCNTPKADGEQLHAVRMAVGNGLRGDVWRDFLLRFGNISIREFYGASDGNTGLQNYVGRVGAIGKVSFYHKRATPFLLAQFDVEQDELVRDARGLCVEVPKGATGLFLSKITAMTPFLGYMNDPEQTSKKMVRDVLEKGDTFLHSGDLMMMDAAGFVFFVDRVGDTFRWKGENVATTEVASVLTALDSVSDASVYGVALPGHEGKAGMAALGLRDGRTLDPRATFVHVSYNLPSFAWPQFIRIQNVLELTGTFKQVKFRLVEEGFDPNTIQDSLFIVDPKGKTYTPLTPDVYDSICSGNLKL